MHIKNPINHYPVLSGIKLAVLFFLVPLYNQGSLFGSSEFWSWYGWVVALLYSVEILCLILFITGNGDKVDNSQEYYFYDDYFYDQTFVYMPYGSYGYGASYINDITNIHTAPFTPIPHHHHH